VCCARRSRLRNDILPELALLLGDRLVGVRLLRCLAGVGCHDVVRVHIPRSVDGHSSSSYVTSWAIWTLLPFSCDCGRPPGVMSGATPAGGSAGSRTAAPAQTRARPAPPARSTRTGPAGRRPA